MQVTVKMPAGNHIMIDAFNNDLISIVKLKIEHKTYLPSGEQRLVFNGEQLKDHFTLDHYKVHHADTISVRLSGLGGMDEEDPDDAKYKFHLLRERKHLLSCAMSSSWRESIADLSEFNEKWQELDEKYMVTERATLLAPGELMRIGKSRARTHDCESESESVP